jgi:type II secretory pathway component PulK
VQLLKLERTEERGFALLAVLWILLILSAIASEAISTAAIQYRIAHSLERHAQAEASAEAGLYKAIGTLIDRDNDAKGWLINGGVNSFSFEDQNVAITIQPEVGKVDVNAADPLLLSALLASVGMPPAKAQSIADALSERRRLGGQAYANAAGVLHLPGMTEDIYRCVQPGLTVYSGRLGVDYSVAVPVIKSAVDWASSNNWGDKTWLQTSGGAFSNLVVQSHSTTLGDTNSVAGSAFTITAVATGADKIKATRSAVVRITGKLDQPYQVLDWGGRLDSLSGLQNQSCGK